MIGEGVASGFHERKAEEGTRCESPKLSCDLLSISYQILLIDTMQFFVWLITCEFPSSIDDYFLTSTAWTVGMQPWHKRAALKCKRKESLNSVRRYHNLGLHAQP